MGGKYASTTAVSVAKSRDEIERVLSKYGASAFAYGWDAGNASVQFVAHDLLIRLTIAAAVREDYARTPTGLRRAAGAIDAAVEQADRQKWRSLLLVIKAKLEAVEAGIVEFEQEFFAHIVLPSGSTVYEDARLPVERAYLSHGVRLALGSGAE